MRAATLSIETLRSVHSLVITRTDAAAALGVDPRNGHGRYARMHGHALPSGGRPTEVNGVPGIPACEYRHPMTRRVSLALAIIAGIAAALLSSTSPSVQFDGQSRTCTALLVAFEEDSSTTTQGLYPVPPSTGDPEWADYQLARACDQKEQQWAWLAGLSALVCVVAGSGARFAGRGDDEEALPDDRTHEAA